MKLDISGTINFQCANTNLSYVAEIVSEKLTSKKGQLDGLENYIRDEVPCVYSDNIFGLRIILMQNPEEETEYQIEILDRLNVNASESFNNFKNIDISNRVYELLKDYEEFVFSDVY